MTVLLRTSKHNVMPCRYTLIHLRRGVCPARARARAATAAAAAVTAYIGKRATGVANTGHSPRHKEKRPDRKQTPGCAMSQGVIRE